MSDPLTEIDVQKLKRLIEWGSGRCVCGERVRSAIHDSRIMDNLAHSPTLIFGDLDPTPTSYPW